MTANINPSPPLRKTLVIALAVVSFVALLPLSFYTAYELFRRPFKPDWDYPVLLVWPDHIDVRWVGAVSEVSPRPQGETYTFNVPPERQVWVEEQVRKITYPNPDVGLAIRVKQLGPDRQRIQLESWGDASMQGLVYEARRDEIVPLYTRAADPMSALFLLLVVHLSFWGGLWLVAPRIWRLTGKIRKRQAVVVVPSNQNS